MPQLALPLVLRHSCPWKLHAPAPMLCLCITWKHPVGPAHVLLQCPREWGKLVPQWISQLLLLCNKQPQVPMACKNIFHMSVTQLGWGICSRLPLAEQLCFQVQDCGVTRKFSSTYLASSWDQQLVNLCSPLTMVPEDKWDHMRLPKVQIRNSCAAASTHIPLAKANDVLKIRAG